MVNKVAVFCRHWLSDLGLWGTVGCCQAVLVVKNLPGNARDTGSISGSGRYPEGGNGNPLQYSCLENPMDRRARGTTVHGVAKRHDWSNVARMHLSQHLTLKFYSFFPHILASPFFLPLRNSISGLSRSLDLLLKTLVREELPGPIPASSDNSHLPWFLSPSSFFKKMIFKFLPHQRHHAICHEE